jgi:hypothetical protein
MQDGMLRMTLWALICAGVTTAATADGLLLSGDTLREAVAGRTVYLSTPAGELPINYRPNGTMTARAGQLAAQFTGLQADTGSWWVARDKLCQQWSNWLDGQAFCYTLRREGPTVYWTRSDGRTGTATIPR